MALEIKGMKRVFKMRKNSQETVLDDPNVNMSPTEVMDFYLSLIHIYIPNYQPAVPQSCHSKWDCLDGFLLPACITE